jgi:POT family proton-dependent oligopeptide transporter
MGEQPKHPKGLYVLFFTEMWERFGFYSMIAMFTLYLRSDEGFKWTAGEATRLLSIYLMFVYASPLVGGWIADRGLGYRRSVLIGGCVFMVGYLLFSIHSIEAVYAALVCLVVGNGFFKPNVSTMVGHLYPEGSPLKDRAFNIFYMGINTGALMSPIVAEFMRHRFGFRPAFTVAAGGMVISVTILWVFKHYVEGNGARLAFSASPAEMADVAATTENLPPHSISHQNPIDAVPDRMRVGALVVIFLIVIIFWMVFSQGGSTFTYWADDNTAWNVSGVISNAINPFWVITLTFPLVWFWGWANRRGMEPSTPTKMALGMVLSAAALALLYVAAKTGEAQQVTPEMYSTADFTVTARSLTELRTQGVPEETVEKLRTAENAEHQPIILGQKMATKEGSSGEEKLTTAVIGALGKDEATRYMPLILKHSYLYKVSPLWLILAYMVMTLGELMLSPMGLSLVSKVAPVRMRGLMMGGWFLATAIGGYLSVIGVFWDRWLHSSFFIVLAFLSLGMSLVLFLLLRPLKKAMPGV